MKRQKIGVLREAIQRGGLEPNFKRSWLLCFRVWALSFRHFLAQHASSVVLRFLFCLDFCFGRWLELVCMADWGEEKGEWPVLVTRAKSLSALRREEPGSIHFLYVLLSECRSLLKSH